MTISLVDGTASSVLPLDDRGFLYGDGLFETMAFRQGQVALWPHHLERLQQSCGRLNLECPDATLLENELSQMTADGEDCSLRLTLTRVTEGVGYGFVPGGGVRRVWTRRALPEPRHGGLRIGVCQTHLARNPLLAGIKHLCRLEHVLAAGEVAAAGWDEGLMLDVEGLIVEATQGNLLFHAQGRWFTPSLDLCGVAGVARAGLRNRMVLESIDLPGSVLDQVDALAVCNAVRGVEAVREVVGVKEFDPAPVAELATDLMPCVFD
ncbi:MAG: aminodeoxychorismate lyase [Xanthomonadales bacterium]|nr:aminodeoxychorismate lyase [Xanthomonadales bacterium]